MASLVVDETLEPYNLSFDKGQTLDLTSKHPEVVEALKHSLIDWNKELAAPGWLDQKNRPWALLLIRSPEPLTSRRPSEEFLLMEIRALLKSLHDLILAYPPQSTFPLDIPRPFLLDLS